MRENIGTKWVKPFYIVSPFLNPLKTSENLWFSLFSGGIEKIPVATNGLKSNGNLALTATMTNASIQIIRRFDIFTITLEASNGFNLEVCQRKPDWTSYLATMIAFVIESI